MSTVTVLRGLIESPVPMIFPDGLKPLLNLSWLRPHPSSARKSQKPQKACLADKLSSNPYKLPPNFNPAI